MSAIAGLWNFDGKPAAAGCGRMLAAQAMYGPHHGAAWCEGEMALGRRLFRSLPEDVQDLGPVIGGGDHLVLAADLRLDARDDLAAELGISAARARTMADAALLLAAYERWELDCFERLVGSFACALWDARAERLVLARDFLGTRPLFFHRGARFFAFASMPKGLHALPDVPYAPDEQRAAEQLALIPPNGSRSFFVGVESVPPGHAMVVTRTGVTSRSHWSPPSRPLRLQRAEDYAEGLRHHLDIAVKAQLRGAGDRVATHLSGGLDSSAVTATAARLMAPAGGKVVAFTSVPREGYDGPDPRNRFGDEGPLAARTAALYDNVEHVLVRTGEATPLDRLDRDFRLYDQPLLNLCSNCLLYTSPSPRDS